MVLHLKICIMIFLPYNRRQSEELKYVIFRVTGVYCLHFLCKRERKGKENATAVVFHIKLEDVLRLILSVPAGLVEV